MSDVSDVATAEDIEVFAPGRVNLIGDHTDYTGGYVLPMAIDLGTTITGRRGGDRVRLRSEVAGAPVDLPLDIDDPTMARPSWGRYVAGVVAELRPRTGFDGEVTTTLPVGGGLSSSAALGTAVALALGFTGTPLELATLVHAAEQRSSGLPCGIMDQLASAAGVAGHALLIDCRSREVKPVPVPDELDVIVLDSGEERALTGSAYAERTAECAEAERILGPLRDASRDDLDRIRDEVVRRRARHVISENERVLAFARALEAKDWTAAGALMLASHSSLRDDFEVSTPTLDHLVHSLCETDGVYGARLTGGGFGGCVVAISRRNALPWVTPVRPSDGARVL